MTSAFRSNGCAFARISGNKLGHPRFHLHFTLTTCYGLNPVNHSIAKITRNRLLRGVFLSITELGVAMYHFRGNDPYPLSRVASNWNLNRGLFAPECRMLTENSSGPIVSCIDKGA